MFEGKLVRIRAYRESDVEPAMNYLNDMNIRRLMTPGIPFPFLLHDEKKWFESLSALKENYSFAIETLAENHYIGGCGINHVDWKNSVAVVGIFIGDEAYHSKGYGTEAMSLLVKFIFEEMNMNKVKLSVYGFNHRAKRSYEKCGFKEEGVLRQEIYREGQYHDEIIMSILRSEYVGFEK